MKDNENNMEFVKEQYSQYWEMLRQHTAFSWQIPALAIVAVIFFINIEPNRLSEWAETPLVPAIAFLVLSLFIAVMLIHHRRNLLFKGYYERALIELEKKIWAFVGSASLTSFPEIKRMAKNFKFSKLISVFTIANNRTIVNECLFPSRSTLSNHYSVLIMC